MEEYKEQITWYMAMTYLQLDETENTRKWLLQIEEGSFKYAEAKELLEQLDK